MNNRTDVGQHDCAGIECCVAASHKGSLYRGLAIGLAMSVCGVLQPGAALGAAPPSGASWEELGPLNIGRFGCKAHAVDSRRVVVVAGRGDEPWIADQSTEVLDLMTGEWTLVSPMPDGFAPGAAPWSAALGDGYVLVTGGFNALSTPGGDLRSYVYSLSRDAWIRTGDLPVGATLVSNLSQTNAVVLNDGRVLIAGGYANGAVESNASLVFTPNRTGLAGGATGNAAGTWDFTRDQLGGITTLNAASEHHKLIKLRDGRVLLIHGYDTSFSSVRWGTVFRDTYGVQAELFDPGTGRWTALPNLPGVSGEDDRHAGVQGVRQQAAVAVLTDGRVLVSGGFSQPADNRGRPLLKEGLYIRSSAILFDPDLFDAGRYPWTITDSMRVARHSHVMATQPGSAGVMTVWGWSPNGGTATAEMYVATQGSWQAAPGMPGWLGSEQAISTRWGCSALLPAGKVLITGGQEDLETGDRSRRTYYYEP